LASARAFSFCLGVYNNVADALAPTRFFRINCGMLVSHHAVEPMQPYFGNRLTLNLRPDLGKGALMRRR